MLPFFFISATVTNLQQKLESLQTANTLMKEDIAIAKNNILQLQQENSVLRSEKEALLDEHRKQLQVNYDAMLYKFILISNTHATSITVFTTFCQLKTQDDVNKRKAVFSQHKLSIYRTKVQSMYPSKKCVLVFRNH